VFAWIFSFCVSYFVFKKSVKIPASVVATNENIKEWKGDQFSIFSGILGWSFLGRSDIFLLAFLVTPSEVGAYFICLRLAETMLFFGTVAYYVWGGELSNLIQGGKIQEGQAILKKSSQLCISTTLLMAGLAFIFAQEILYFVNETYADYSYLFRIALVMFFVKGASGMMKPLYYILGEQDFLAKIQWAIGLSFTGLVLTIVPIFGVIGCILSFALCELIFFIILVRRLHKKHHLSLMPF
jgi:O-antigen/teichoic acid export membrane protein